MQTFELCMDETTPNQWVLIWLLGSFYNTPEQIHLQENSTWEVAFLAAQDARLAGASSVPRSTRLAFPTLRPLSEGVHI
jgi:hypothetical protein